MKPKSVSHTRQQQRIKYPIPTVPTTTTAGRKTSQENKFNKNSVKIKINESDHNHAFIYSDAGDDKNRDHEYDSDHKGDDDDDDADSYSSDSRSSGDEQVKIYFDGEECFPESFPVQKNTIASLMKEAMPKLETLERQFLTWSAVNISITIVWITLLVTSVCFYVQHKTRCDRIEDFGILGICILSSLVIRYLYCTILVAVAYQRCRKLEWKSKVHAISHSEKDTVPVDSTTKELQFIHEQLAKGKCSPAIEATMHMGRIIDMFHHMQSLMKQDDFDVDKTKTVAPNTQARDLMTALNSLHASSFLWGRIHRPQSTSIETNMPSSEMKGKTSSKKTYRFMGLLSIGCYDSVPVISVILYIATVALTTRSNSFAVNDTECAPLLTFNWTIVGLCIFHNFVCILPILCRLIRIYK